MRITVTDATPILGGYVAFLPPPLGDATPLDGGTELKKFTQEVRLTSPTSNHLEWQLGGFYTHEDGRAGSEPVFRGCSQRAELRLDPPARGGFHL